MQTTYDALYVNYVMVTAQAKLSSHVLSYGYK